MDEQENIPRETPEPLSEAALARVDGAGQGLQGKYQVGVRSDASMPEGLARVLDIINGAVSPSS